MGSGKTTLGPRVAEGLGWRFLDLDAAIERRAGQSVRRLFDEAGEAAFRRLEAQALRVTGEEEQLVVALGGGTLVAEENRRWALAHGTVVYLHVSPEELARRLEPDVAQRPLLHGTDAVPLAQAALRDRVAELLRAREASYREAHHVVEADGQRIAETVAAVLRAVRAGG